MQTSARGVPVTLPDGSIRYVNKLLSTPRKDERRFNAKLVKSNRHKRYLTVGLSLAPGNMSGYEVCASRSAGCTAACLVNSGYAFFYSSINQARVAKTILFFEDRELFMRKLVREIGLWRGKARLAKRKLVVRLNVFSDIMWEKVSPELFTTFRDVQFYDYTKHTKRMFAFCAGHLPHNYHLTFSRSECNENDCLSVLRSGGNVAVVFEDRDLPDTWNGYRVVNGDKTDLRFLDGGSAGPVVIGLYAKGIYGKADKTGFVLKKFSLPLLS